MHHSPYGLSSYYIIFQSWGVMVDTVILKEVKDWFTENKIEDQTKAENGQGESSTGQK